MGDARWRPASLPLLLLAALLAAACAHRPLPEPVPARRAHAAPDQVAAWRAALEAPRLDPAEVTLRAEPGTIEDHWILHAYDRIRGGEYGAWRIAFPGVDGTPGAAHFLRPPGPGPHPAVLVFPILGGSHVVSEALAKALVNRGYAVLRVERRRLFPRKEEPETGDFGAPAEAMRAALRDGRRLLDWLEQAPGVDPERLAVAGVSIGGIMGATLMGVDERLRAGVFLMAGGGLPELLRDSTERPLVRIRELFFAEHGTRDPEAFAAHVRPLASPLDPLHFASGIDPRRVVLISGRFDRVVPPERTEALWEALGRPAWRSFPAGHYSFAPFFWWAAGRGADHLDRVLPDPMDETLASGRGRPSWTD